jgi:cobalt-zinc-cadmium resistance protein CzcA
LLSWIIDVSLRYPLGVILGAGAFAVLGALALAHLDIDAFPDTTPVQVQINTVAPALGPDEVETQITMPIEQRIGGLPRLQQLRSVSKFGLSQVVVTFDDGTDIYFARQLINERLGTVQLPVGIERPQLGPVATGLGEVFHYVVTSQGKDLTDLRTVHDWQIRPKLRTVRGVAEVNSWGGNEKQYQIRVDPNALINHDLNFDQVVEAVEKNNRNVGGGSIRRGSQMLLVHGVGRTVNEQQIKDIVITSRDGHPIRVGHVAEVTLGHEMRRGAVTADGKGEVVLGLGFMLMGENSHEVTWALKKKLDEVGTTLPKDAHGRPVYEVEPVYDRTELVDHVIDTVRDNLLLGGLLVVAILFLFLGNLRAACIVALAIPLSMLFAFSGMLRFGIAASLLSLGAIDFGMVVDSSVVMVENCVRHMARAELGGRSKREIVRDAAVEVRRPTLFGELIIMIVYLPILTLEGIEGKLFRPMALTVIFALAGSMVLSLTLMPVLASLLLPRRINAREPLLMRLVKWVYAPILQFSMRYRVAVLVFALCVLLVAFGLIAPNLGSEFVPQLSEGAIVINVVRLAGTDLKESIRVNTQMEKAVLEAFPEVDHVWSRIGTAEVATDPMGVELTDFFITLKPRDQWQQARAQRLERLPAEGAANQALRDELTRRQAATQAELSDLIEKELRQIPGQRIAPTQPIEMRLNEMVSGVRLDVAVKLYGDDFKVLVERAKEIQHVLEQIPGSVDVTTEQITGQPVLEIKVKQEELALHGVPAQAVLDLVESVGSKPLGEVVESQYRFPLVVRLPEGHRASKETIEAIPLSTARGERIPLGELAEVKEVQGPSTITREWGQRRITVTCNVRNRDVGSFVAEAQEKMRPIQAALPPRYHIEWGGQFEHLDRARTRLFIVVPLALVLILGLLYLTYHNVMDALRVFTGVPFAWVGGIVALWLRGMPFSISAAVGFIALSGVAVLDDMILVSYIRQLREEGLAVGEAVRQAALTRLRPVLMTTLVASLGFLPMALSTGMGAEVQRPLATVVIGGVLSAMVMSLLVLRVLYVVVDWLARLAYGLLHRGLGIRDEVLRPVFGLHAADMLSRRPYEPPG